MSLEKQRLPISPLHMAESLRRSRGIGAVVVPRVVESSALESAERPEDTRGPFEGKVVAKGGQKYRFEKVPTGRLVWDSDAQERVPEHYSLKTYFSHHTDGLGAGPGWDIRRRLDTLAPEEMRERYGHVFTPQEIFSPTGWRDEVTNEVVGGMPDIPYYTLTPLAAE